MNQMGEKKKIILCRQTGECGCRQVGDVIPWTNYMAQVQSSRDLTFNWLLWTFPFFRTGFIYLFVWFHWLQFFHFFHTVNTWRAGGESARGQKEQNRLPSTSWGRRHITLMVSVNISLTPVPLLAKHLPPLLFPLQPTETHRSPLFLQPPREPLPGGLFVSLPGAQAVEH